MIDQPSVASSPDPNRVKIVFVMYNVVLWTTGLILLWFGVWMEVEFSRYISGGAQLVISYTLLGMGSVLVLFNSVACFCALKGERGILNLYALVLGAVFIIELVLSVSMVALKRSLMARFNGQNLSGGGDPAIDMPLIQSTFLCCGLTRGPLDYTAAWLFVPRSCCLPQLTHCHSSNEEHLFSRGCYHEMEKFVDNNIGAMALLALCFSAVTLLGVISSLAWARRAAYEEIQGGADDCQETGRRD